MGATEQSPAPGLSLPALHPSLARAPALPTASGLCFQTAVTGKQVPQQVPTNVLGKMWPKKKKQNQKNPSQGTGPGGGAGALMESQRLDSNLLSPLGSSLGVCTQRFPETRSPVSLWLQPQPSYLHPLWDRRVTRRPSCLPTFSLREKGPCPLF